MAQPQREVARPEKDFPAAYVDSLVVKECCELVFICLWRFVASGRFVSALQCYLRVRVRRARFLVTQVVNTSFLFSEARIMA